MEPANRNLRGYIPLAAPLNWEPVTGEESPLRLVIGFTTNWFSRRAGIDFRKPFHENPAFRFESLLRMKRYVHETFPEIAYFREHDTGGFEQECATLSGLYGACLVGMLYGLEPVYYQNNWPAIRPEHHLSAEEVKKLKPFHLESLPLVGNLVRQMDIIEKNWGKIDGYVNFQGVLNNAFKIRGTEIFTDMYDDPELCHFLFEHITDTMIRLSKLIFRRQCASGFPIDSLGISNCTVNLISPADYRMFVLPYDKRLSMSFSRHGIHSCNWVLDPYARDFSTVGKIGYIDFGFASDLSLIKACFPEARREVFYDPMFLHRKSPEEVRRDIEKIYRELAPCDLCLPDVDLMIPDEKVKMFANVAASVLTDQQ